MLGTLLQVLILIISQENHKRLQKLPIQVHCKKNVAFSQKTEFYNINKNLSGKKVFINMFLPFLVSGDISGKDLKCF